jgi:hypothetical protein
MVGYLGIRDGAAQGPIECDCLVIGVCRTSTL